MVGGHKSYMESSNVIHVDFTSGTRTTELVNRSKVARQAWSRTSAGPMDSRPKRQRSRAAAKRAAIREHS
jgi:hypothetical protein